MSKQRRIYKIAERVKSVIAMQLHRLADPRFEMVTITSINMSSDMRHAKVYWTSYGGKDRVEQVADAFDGASGALKRELAKELGSRVTPSLSFYYDDTLDVIEETEELMAQVLDSKV